MITTVLMITLLAGLALTVIVVRRVLALANGSG